jgi:hypothetical protein
MSKALVPLLAVATLGLSAAAWQTYQLSSERSRAVAFSAQLKESEVKMALLEKEAARLRDLNNVFQSESEQLRKKLADRSAKTAPSASDPSADPVLPAAEGEGKGGEPKQEKKNFMQGLAKMFTDPEMKKAMRGQQAMGIRMMYSDLAKELGLTPDEATAVSELLTDRQMEMAGKSMEMLDGDTANAEKLAASGKAATEAREEYDKQIASLLGEDRYKKFQDYEKTVGERVALSQLQQQFAAKGLTIEDGQRKELLNIMVEEREKAPASPFDASSKDVTGQMKALQSDQGITQMLDRQKQINSRVLTRASNVLSPDQVNALRESQEQFLQMQEFGIKMGKQMLSK